MVTRSVLSMEEDCDGVSDEKVKELGRDLTAIVMLSVNLPFDHRNLRCLLEVTSLARAWRESGSSITRIRC